MGSANLLARVYKTTHHVQAHSRAGVSYVLLRRYDMYRGMHTRPRLWVLVRSAEGIEASTQWFHYIGPQYEVPDI